MNETVKLAPEYDWRISAKKAVLTFGKTLFGIAFAAVLQYLTSADNVGLLLKDYPALLAVAPLVAGICTYALNAWKHRDA